MKKAFATKLLCTTMLSGMALSGAAWAQEIPIGSEEEAGVEQPQDVVQVTGSRIVRPGLVSPSPVTSVDAEALEVNNTVNVEDYLNDLPQLIPALDATSNNPGNGTATLSLRGLGASRTLILLDGTRMVGEGSGQTVNINTIPTALIERIDIVTGGASAVYGSDAVAGVVNFILKDDFEGVEFDVSQRWTERGGAANFNTSLTMGGNFDSGRGNAVLTMSYTDREELFQGQREFSEDTLIDNGSGTFGTTGSINIPETLLLSPVFGTFPSGVSPELDANRSARCANYGAPTSDNCWGFGIFVDDNGEIQPFRTSGPNNDRYNYAPDNYLQLPQERYNLASFVTYEINEHAELYGRAIYTNAIVDSQLAPTPGGLQFDFEIDESNPYLTGQLKDLFDATPGINQGDTDSDGLDEYIFTTSRRYQELGPRNSLRDTHTFQLGTGIRGDITSNWTYDLWGQYSRSRADQIQTGNVSISAVQDVVADGTWNIFGGPNTITPAIADRITRTGAIFTENTQTQIIGTVAGQLEQFRSPMADRSVAVVFGAEYRDEYIKRQPDSVLGPDVMGFNQSTFIEGRFDVYEVFGEVDVPLVEGEPGIEYLGLNGAYRYSDYSSVGQVNSYAFGGEYMPIDGLRFRAQFQRAVRAPSIGQLFQSTTNGFPGVQDPCAGGSNGAFNLLDPAQQTAVIANCENLEGVTPGAVPVPQFNSQVEALFVGATDLEAEEADTITIGVVYQPEFVPGLTVAVDYYDIEVANALGGPTAQQVVNDCVLFGNAAACAITQRGGNGALTLFDSLGAANQVGLFVEGVDYSIDYIIDPNWDFGSFGLQVEGTVLQTNSFQPTASLGAIECAGFYGADCGEPTPESKWLASGRWMYGPLTTTLRWTHLGEVTDVQTQFYGAYADGLDVTEIDAFDYFDVNFNYAATDSVELRAGVRNIFDEQPPRLGDGPQSEQANTWPATYDPFGRQFFVGLTYRR